jgi:hypothetical protein
MRCGGLSIAAVLAVTLLIGGVQATPARLSGGGLGRQVVVSLRVRGRVDLTSDYYCVLFNVNGRSRNGFTGPVPVVTDYQRGGNGFAGGAFTLFVEGHQGEPRGSSFGLYAAGPDGRGRTYLGMPLQESVSGDTLSFRMPLAAIATASGLPEDRIATLQINVVATNVVPVDPQDTTVKYFDALGDPHDNAVNAFLTLSPAQATTYRNRTSVRPEGPGDVAAYDGAGNITVVPGQDAPTDKAPAALTAIDIVDWTLEFRG